MLLFYYNVRVLRFIVRAALPPITDNLRAAQSPTHSANIRKCKIITKFAIINGFIIPQRKGRPCIGTPFSKS